MNDAPTKLLEERIAAVIERVRALAAERESLRKEVEALRARIGDAERASRAAHDRDLERLERENRRLRDALEGAIRELREESGT